MPQRSLTIGCGPREDAPPYVDLAFRTYGKDGNPATLIITVHPAESVADAGFQSAIFIQPDSRLTFPYQVGEMIGFLGSFLGVLATVEEEFVGIIFVNHLPRDPAGPVPARTRQELSGTPQAIQRFCELVSKSLTTGGHPWSPRESDWVYLDCE